MKKWKKLTKNWNENPFLNAIKGLSCFSLGGTTHEVLNPHTMRCIFVAFYYVNMSPIPMIILIQMCLILELKWD
jgi:hypothetical protein